MNLFKELNKNEIELLKNADVKVIDKEYTSEELKKIETSVEEFIMMHSQKEISRISNQYSNLLSKVIQGE